MYGVRADLAGESGEGARDARAEADDDPGQEGDERRREQEPALSHDARRRAPPEQAVLDVAHEQEPEDRQRREPHDHAVRAQRDEDLEARVHEVCDGARLIVNYTSTARRPDLISPLPPRPSLHLSLRIQCGSNVKESSLNDTFGLTRQPDDPP